MGLTELIFKTGGLASVGAIQFDAMVSETHSAQADVTEHAVEYGADITDHIRMRAREVVLNGVISNTPVVFLASVQAKSPLIDDTERTVDRVEVAHKEILRTMRAGELVTIVTSLEDYPPEMAITSYSVTRDAENGNVLNASLTLKQVFISKTEQDVGNPAPAPVNVGNKEPEPKGKKPKKKPKPKQTAKVEEQQSMLHGLLF